MRARVFEKKQRINFRRGESYIDTVITFLVVALCLVFALNCFTVVNYHHRVDYYASEIVTVATVNGTSSVSDSSVQNRIAQLREETGLNLAVNISTPHGGTLPGTSHVQYGNEIVVRLTGNTTLFGDGFFLPGGVQIPVDYEKSGLSQRYWKS